MEPLFTAKPLPRADVKNAIPEESRHPGSLTARIRRALLTGPEHLFYAEQRQAEYLQAEAEASVEPRN
jgi:hypothetical protein